MQDCPRGFKRNWISVKVIKLLRSINFLNVLYLLSLLNLYIGKAYIENVELQEIRFRQIKLKLFLFLNFDKFLNCALRAV